jgi:hypothetical protein
VDFYLLFAINLCAFQKREKRSKKKLVLFEELFQSGFLWNLIARNLVIVLWKR